MTELLASLRKAPTPTGAYKKELYEIPNHAFKKEKYKML